MTGAGSDAARARLLQDRALLIQGDIDGATADRICADLLQLAAEDGAADIFVYINSPGGLVSAGVAVRDLIKYLQADVFTVVVGMAAGTAQLVLSAGTPGKRCALPHAGIRLAAPTGARPPAAGSEGAGPEHVLRMIAEDTGLPLGQVVADAAQGRWFTAQEALANGLVDRILTAPPTATSPPASEEPELVPASPRRAVADHGQRVLALGAAVESVVFHHDRDVRGVHPHDGRRLRTDLAEALLRVLPEWLGVDAAYAGWAEAAEAAARLRSWLETAPDSGERPARPSERLSLRGVLHEMVERIDELPLLGDGDRRLGYEAGLRAARRGLLLRAEPTDGQDAAPAAAGAKPPLPTGLGDDRARPESAPVALPDRTEQIKRFARVLRRRLVLSAGDCAELADRLQRSAAAPDPVAYARAHRQWTLHENMVTDLEGRLRARTGLTPDEAHRRQQIARDLDDLAASLVPVGTATGSFPAAFEAATRRVVAILRSTAGRLRPPWAPSP